MTADQFISLYTITLAIVAPVVGAVVWLAEKEKTKRIVAKENSVGATAIARVETKMVEHGNNFINTNQRLTLVENMSREYLDALKDALNHYTKK